MDTLIGKLKAELQLLELTQEKTESIISTGITEKICRHKEALQSIVAGTEEAKREVEQAKLEGGEASDKVKEWGKEMELKIDAADTEITLLKECANRMMADAENEERETKETLLACQREEQLKFERQQLEQKAEFAKEKVSSPSKQNVKLSKLVITKYNGALENWLAFWNKFEAEIDKTDLPSVTKFAYLKELVEPRVRKGIDGLPFTSEGYERAKNILQTNYGQTSEIINVYVENIQALPAISATHPWKIHDFFETLLYNVQLLETLNVGLQGIGSRSLEQAAGNRSKTSPRETGLENV